MSVRIGERALAQEEYMLLQSALTGLSLQMRKRLREQSENLATASIGHLQWASNLCEELAHEIEVATVVQDEIDTQLHNNP